MAVTLYEKVLVGIIGKPLVSTCPTNAIAVRVLVNKVTQGKKLRNIRKLTWKKFRVRNFDF